MEPKLDECRLVLIRHGETEWNRDGRWQGQTDVPLSAAGREQAARLARRLLADGWRFDALYSSDQGRALETARILGEATGLAPSTTPALREINLGAWAGHTKEEIAKLHPAEWSRMEAGEDIARGGGETYAQFQARILEWLIPAARRHAGETVGVVTHGGVIRAILLYASNLQWKDRSRIPSIGNATVSVLNIQGDRWTTEAAGLYSGAEADDAIMPVNEGEVI